MLLVQLRREVSDVRLVHQHHRPRRRQPPHPLRHLQPHLLRRMDLRRLHRALREERAEQHVELRAVGAGRWRLHLGGVLVGRGHGGEQRGGRVDDGQRGRGGQAVPAGRHEPGELPAGPGQPGAGPGHHAPGGAVVPPLPRLPVHRRAAAAALPHLRRRPLGRAALEQLPRAAPQLRLRRRRLRHGRRVQRVRRRRVQHEKVARRDGRARVGRAHAGRRRAGALLQAPRPVLVLRARLCAGGRVRARYRRRRRRVQARRRRARRRQPPGAGRRRPRLRLPPGAGVPGAAGQGVQGEAVLELVPPLRRPRRGGLRHCQRLHRAVHRARGRHAQRVLRHLPRGLGPRLGSSRGQALEDRQIQPLMVRWRARVWVREGRRFMYTVHVQYYALLDYYYIYCVLL